MPDAIGIEYDLTNRTTKVWVVFFDRLNPKTYMYDFIESKQKRNGFAIMLSLEPYQYGMNNLKEIPKKRVAYSAQSFKS